MILPPQDIAAAFKGKRVFVTGHTGFKGSWLCLLLRQLGADIGGYALAPEQPGLYRLLNIDKVMSTSHINDIRDLNTLTDALHGFAPDVVFHLAAQPLVLPALEQPVETFATNVMGTVHVLEALRTYKKATAAVIISSDKCYKNTGGSKPYSETDPLGGSDPYTASKACTEIVTNAYRESYFNQGTLIASARAGNVLGGGDFGLHRLVPDLVRAVQNNQSLTLRYPNAIRPWQYILDVLWGYVTLAGSLMLGGRSYASEYNFANAFATPMTVNDIVSQMLRIWELDNSIVKTENPKHAETHTLLIDPTKSAKILGWKSLLDNTAMLKETAQWYQLLLKKDPTLADYTQAHIHDYLTKVTEK